MLSEVKRMFCPGLQPFAFWQQDYRAIEPSSMHPNSLPDEANLSERGRRLRPRRHWVKIGYLRRVVRPVNVAPDRMYGSLLMTVSAIFRPLSSFGYPTRIGVQLYQPITDRP